MSLPPVCSAACLPGPEPPRAPAPHITHNLRQLGAVQLRWLNVRWRDYHSCCRSQGAARVGAYLNFMQTVYIAARLRMGEVQIL